MTPARRTLIVASVLSLFVLAGLASTVMAHPEGADSKDDRKDAKAERKDMKEERKDERKEAKEDRKEAKKELKDERKDEKRESKAKFFEGNTTLQLSGKGVGRDNVTYSFTIDASGKGLSRVKERDGNVTHFRGIMKAHVVLLAENGTALKEGDMRLKVFARESDDGWKWQVVSTGELPNGMPRLVLRGEAENVAPGEFDLEGRGHAVLRVDGHALPIKIPEVTGTFTRELPPAPAPAPATTDAADEE